MFIYHTTHWVLLVYSLTSYLGTIFVCCCWDKIKVFFSVKEERDKINITTAGRLVHGLAERKYVGLCKQTNTMDVLVCK